jgi:hypothetical protein
MISKSHASHIRKVNVGFIISGPKVKPEQLSALINTLPDRSARKGDERRNAKGQILGYEKNGWWRIDSMPRLKVSGIRKKDINEHLKVLLDILLPHRERLNKLSEGGETFFDVVWKSSYLYAGTGPLIEARYLEGVADLKAGIGFDIYQVDEDEE